LSFLVGAETTALVLVSTISHRDGVVGVSTFAKDPLQSISFLKYLPDCWH
jgi:hypothetical protein